VAERTEMTRVERAIDECRQVAVALAKMGRPATVTEIVAASGLPREMVVRRLRGANMDPLSAYRYFRFDRLAKTWSLTTGGVALAKV